MSLSLIVAEKPSVARDIAAALGGFKKSGDGVFERRDAIISSAIGHLVTIACPESEDRKGGLEVLPVIPQAFELVPIQKTTSQLRLLGRLLKRSDVTCVVNACDAGREGELIFRYIYDYCGSRKPMKRLWLQSMTPDAIREGYAHLKDGATMEPLYAAARCRSEADWLIGINGSRGLTDLLRGANAAGREIASAGRVQTPTLAMVVAREEEISSFCPRDYWEIHARFQTSGGEYVGKWIDERPAVAAASEGVDGERADRLFDRSKALEILRKCEGQAAQVLSDESKEVKSAPPKLFDLTSLQREANGKFGFSAKKTLDLAQALYETHKALTYPRTDANALPEDYVETAARTLEKLSSLDRLGAFARKAIDSAWVKPDKRIFDNEKISDHFAIIPTGVIPSALGVDEAKLYDLVVKRFIAVFYPAARYTQTIRRTGVAGEVFKSQGRVLIDEGYLAVYGKDADTEGDESALCPWKKGDPVRLLSLEDVALKTKPPARYTEATLLGAMENAGRLVSDEALREAMSERGLGTPATRAAIIEGLLSQKKQFMRREGKSLVPTDKGTGLIRLLRELEVETLVSPVMTGEWEFKLLQMQKGGYRRSEFMKEIAEITRSVIAQIKSRASARQIQEAVYLNASCPKCNAARLAGTSRAFQCGGCGFSLWREVAGRQLSEAEAEILVRDGQIGSLDGFISRRKQKFAAGLKLDRQSGKVEFVFGEASPAPPSEDEEGERCAKCGNGVMRSKNGPRGPFKGCSLYPVCRHTAPA